MLNAVTFAFVGASAACGAKVRQFKQIGPHTARGGYAVRRAHASATGAGATARRRFDRLCHSGTTATADRDDRNPNCRNDRNADRWMTAPSTAGMMWRTCRPIREAQL